MIMNFKYGMIMISHLRFDETIIHEHLPRLDHVMQRLVKLALRSTQSPGSSGNDFITNQRQSHTLNSDKQAIVSIKILGGSISTFSYLGLCLIPFQLNKLDMPKELGDMKAGFVRG